MCVIRQDTRVRAPNIPERTGSRTGSPTTGVRAPLCCKCPGPKHARPHQTRTMPRDHAAPLGRLLANSSCTTTHTHT